MSLNKILREQYSQVREFRFDFRSTLLRHLYCKNRIRIKLTSSIPLRKLEVVPSRWNIEQFETKILTIKIEIQ